MKYFLRVKEECVDELEIFRFELKMIVFLNKKNCFLEVFAAFFESASIMIYINLKKYIFPKSASALIRSNLALVNTYGSHLGKKRNTLKLMRLHHPILV